MQTIPMATPAQPATVQPAVDEFGFPYDDEPITPEEAEALDRFERGEGVFTPHAEFMRELGLDP